MPGTEIYPPRRWSFVKSSHAGQKQPVSLIDGAVDVLHAQKSSPGWYRLREWRL